jgi:hypothetical protein
MTDSEILALVRLHVGARGNFSGDEIFQARAFEMLAFARALLRRNASLADAQKQFAASITSSASELPRGQSAQQRCQCRPGGCRGGMAPGGPLNHARQLVQATTNCAQEGFQSTVPLAMLLGWHE